MKRCWVFGLWGLLLLCAFGVGLKFAPAKAQIEVPTRGRECNAALLLGGYALALDGEIIHGNNAGPYAAVAVLSFDGKGGAGMAVTQSYNGTLLPVSSIVGRYVMGNDCAGQLIFNTGARFDFVTDNRGGEIRLLQTNPGNVVRGLARKQ